MSELNILEIRNYPTRAADRKAELEAERDALRAEVTRLKVDKELLNREYEAVREHMAALSDESRTLFVAIMESGNKEGE